MKFCGLFIIKEPIYRVYQNPLYTNSVITDMDTVLTPKEFKRLKRKEETD
jgi:hypothetical protein